LSINRTFYLFGFIEVILVRVAYYYNQTSPCRLFFLLVIKLAGTKYTNLLFSWLEIILTLVQYLSKSNPKYILTQIPIPVKQKVGTSCITHILAGQSSIKPSRTTQATPFLRLSYDDDSLYCGGCSGKLESRKQRSLRQKNNLYS
jgi:hypothetical protein